MVAIELKNQKSRVKKMFGRVKMMMVELSLTLDF